MPTGLVQVSGWLGHRIGDADHRAFAIFLMFTGSTEPGRRVAARPAERLIDCSLELGGKNAMLVLDDADVEQGGDGAVRAAFSNAGQLCISIERMYIPNTLWDDFVRDSSPPPTR